MNAPKMGKKFITLRVCLFWTVINKTRYVCAKLLEWFMKNVVAGDRWEFCARFGDNVNSSEERGQVKNIADAASDACVSFTWSNLFSRCVTYRGHYVTIAAFIERFYEGQKQCSQLRACFHCSVSTFFLPPPPSLLLSFLSLPLPAHITPVRH